MSQSAHAQFSVDRSAQSGAGNDETRIGDRADKVSDEVLSLKKEVHQ